MRDLTKFLDEAYYGNLEYPSGWINAVWWHDDNLTFSEQKELFFLTLKKLLDDGKVVFFHPFPEAKVKIYTHYVDGKKYDEELWDESSDNIIAYIKSIFPKGIKDENDEILTNFWYGICPEIGWIDQEDGFIHAS